jgi:hypothetical protein
MHFLSFFSVIEDNPEKVRQLLDSVLSQKQFSGLQQQDKNVIQKIIEWLGNNEIIKKITGYLAEFLGTLAKALLARPEVIYIVLFLLLAAILTYVIITVRRKISKSHIRSQGDDGHPESINPEVREKQGFAAAENGDFVQAMRQLYISLLLFFNIKGIIEYNPARTNKETEDLLRGRSPDEFLKNFCGLNRIFEDKVYALNTCSSGDFSRFREYYDICRKELERI